MAAGLLRDGLTVGVGVASGMLSAVAGVGGAVVSTPGIRALGASAFVAVGTTLPSILPGAASGTLRYRREGLVDWRLVGWAAPSGAAATVAGSLLSHAVPGQGHLLMLATAALLALTAVRTVRHRGGPGPGPAPVPASGVPGSPVPASGVPASGAGRDGQPGPGRRASFRRAAWPAAVAVGAGAGLLSGLLGVGGGIVLVPGFGELLGLPIKAAIATSLACVGILAIPGTVTHALLGDIDWRFAALLALGVVPGARLGAAVAVRAAERPLRLGLGALLGLIAVWYMASELRALVR
ncbi:MAG TPA: sulfite exporter TauE/SafE family protein [Actinomycetota bacterium]|nr:sulfite exporter TauE/SafE family protein [Actinomycetota bacterium]